jgi:hypothetical protein
LWPVASDFSLGFDVSLGGEAEVGRAAEFAASVEKTRRRPWVCSLLVSGPQTDLGELDMLNNDSYNWADRGVAPQLFTDQLSRKPPVRMK